ncbi:flavin-containing monooxygenase 5-like isoform X1 [Haliotis rufescens]|uniref:flavin-containing monooxygenase 5-like isoform X1 n=1 Tax=Haliotis rufescens TaxID=6454 RepID=UPI00201FA10F|nr:flavin-containing monooxygenase 5-like isoform X1 [Haliotis rufescens]
MAKRVAIIGAGCSGLTAIKCCVDEKLEPFCFERTDELGGLWNFTEKVREDQGCVMKSTVINTSKEMMCYSDFPIPKEFPNFMYNTQVWQYFKMYADAFNLSKHIQYNKEILSVKKSRDYEQTGRWDLQVRDHKTGSEETQVFDAVMVCTGHHASKNVPEFTGQDDFQGKILHSQDYKDWTGYTGKRVVVVGVGNSGGDAAVELSRVGQVFLSTRRGTWVFNRIADNGIPADFQLASRFLRKILHTLPQETLSGILQKQLNKRFDHELYSLKPKHSVFAQHPTVNDDMPNRIATGRLKIKADIKRFTKTGVEFVDGTVEDNIDVVILATGYIFGFPFIDKSVIDVQKNKVKMFKYMFPPDLPKQTLVVIGCFQPIGAIMPIVELQCRLATRVFKGTCSLPSKYEMWADIGKKEAAMAAKYVESQRHTIQVDYVDFMDELAELVGCRPAIGRLLLTDPKLGLKCYFGPATPYQYRLRGPGTWPGAREAIMTQTDRMEYPFKTRPLPEGTETQSSHRLLTLVLLVLVIAILYQLFKSDVRSL